MDSINKSTVEKKPDEMMEKHIAQTEIAPKALSEETLSGSTSGEPVENDIPIDDRSKEEVKQDDTDLYNISNFSV